jgi:hypothetical protein
MLQAKHALSALEYTVVSYQNCSNRECVFFVLPPCSMDALDRLWHVLGLLAPAFWVAVLSASGWALVTVRTGGLGWRRWRWMTAVGTLAGVAVVVGGLGWFGRDGKMATYAALCVAVALAQWAVVQWRS